MTYLSKNSRKNETTLKKILIPIAVLVVLFIASLLFSHAIGGFIYAIGRPLWYAENAVSDRFSTFTLTLSEKKQLSLDNSQLREQLQSLEAELQTTHVIEAENQTLKIALHRKEDASSTIAALLTKPPFSPYDTSIIDIGQDHAVSIGDTVFVQGNVLVGKISAVYAHTAQVTFFSSPGQKFDAIVGDTNVEGQAEGKGGGNFQMTLPKNAEVKKGDAVILPSLSTDVYGIVDDIENVSNDSFIQIYFRSPVNIGALRFVEVGKK